MRTKQKHQQHEWYQVYARISDWSLPMWGKMGQHASIATSGGDLYYQIPCHPPWKGKKENRLSLYASLRGPPRGSLSRKSITTSPWIGCQSIARLHPRISSDFPEHLLVSISTNGWTERHFQSNMFCPSKRPGLEPRPLRSGLAS